MENCELNNVNNNAINNMVKQPPTWKLRIKHSEQCGQQYGQTAAHTENEELNIVNNNAVNNMVK